MTPEQLQVKVRELAILLTTGHEGVTHPGTDLFSCDVDTEGCNILTVRIDLDKI